MKEVIEFIGHQVEIRRRPYQTRLGVSIYPNGKIAVSTNKTQSAQSILKFLLERQDWIQKSLDEVEEFRKKYPPKKFQSGETYPYLGQQYPLEFIPGRKAQLIISDGKLNFYTPVPEQEWTPELRQKYFLILKKSYKEVAKKLISQRVDFFAHKMQLFPTKVGFRNQKSIWGSCSPENRISLNCKLIIAPLGVIDYVVVHELSHIRHKNHSKRFWELVEKYVDTRDISKKWLSENHYQADFLSPESELWL